VATAIAVYHVTPDIPDGDERHSNSLHIIPLG
jgi:hypothetical protein